MRSWRRPLVVVASLAVLVVLALLGFAVGTKPLALSTTWDAVVAFDPGNSDHLLVRYLRVPRTVLAVVVGCCLGVAGTVMQALTRNALADPGILGVNAGAAAAIAAAIAFFGVTSVTSYMWFGLFGAALAGVAVYFLGGMRRGSSPVRLVLAGAALSIVLLALTQVVIVNSEETVFDQFRHWTVGSLQGRGTSVVLPVGLLALVGVGTAFGLARALNAAVLGEEVGRALGADPVRVWSLAALAVILTSGAATAAAGPVGFVGLTAPHLARFVTGPDHRWVLPVSMLFSAVLVLGADVLGRVVAPPGEVGVGIMVALIGGPFFVYLVRSRKLVQL